MTPPTRPQPRPSHETHVCRDCGAEITLPYVKTGTIEVPIATVIREVEKLASEVTDFLDEATNGPWRPESDIDDEGLARRRTTIWLTNDDGDSLQIDEDTAALLVEALRFVA